MNDLLISEWNIVRRNRCIFIKYSVTESQKANASNLRQISRTGYRYCIINLFLRKAIMSFSPFTTPKISNMP